MTNININKLVDTFLDTVEEVAEAITEAVTKPKQPTEEPNEVPEAPTEGDGAGDEEIYLLSGEELFELLYGDDEDGEEVDPAWEAVELLRKAEVAADKGDEFASTNYIAIADRYIKLAETFAVTTVTVSE